MVGNQFGPPSNRRAPTILRMIRDLDQSNVSLTSYRESLILAQYLLLSPHCGRAFLHVERSLLAVLCCANSPF